MPTTAPAPASAPAPAASAPEDPRPARKAAGGGICQVVRARGELDVTSVPAFSRALRGAIREGEGRLHIVLDLREVSFADGSILRPLEEARAECQGSGGWLRVVYAGYALALLFAAGGLSDRYPRYATVRDAARQNAPAVVAR
ncbi:STAS domain-containing protein [Streptomyces tsukubensis]|nr:STAS domain-containing protein [Streptomyces tsukubensis]